MIAFVGPFVAACFRSSQFSDQLIISAQNSDGEFYFSFFISSCSEQITLGMRSCNELSIVPVKSALIQASLLSSEFIEC